MDERIRRIEGRKKSVFLSRGIFHNGKARTSSKLKAVRHNYSPEIGYERIVFDFETDEVPRFFGHIDGEGKKIFVDLFQTGLSETSPGSFGHSKYVENIDFFPITEDILSVEISFKEKISADIFYLESSGTSPGRFVFDVKI